jgi:hypothetical protein
MGFIDRTNHLEEIPLVSNLPPPGPEYPETRRTGARVIQHPNGYNMYALVARDSHGNPMVMSHDVDPINLVVMSVQMGYGQAINLGTTLPTDPGERELWSAAVDSFDAVMREHNKRQASLHDNPQAEAEAEASAEATMDKDDVEAELAKQLREPTLDVLTDTLRADIMKHNPDDDDPEASAEAGDRPSKPRSPSDAAAADMPDEHVALDIDVDDLSAINQARLETGHQPEPPEASTQLSDAEWLAQHQAKIDEMRASYGFTAEQYTATMQAEQARKEARANLAPTPPPSHAPGEMSEAKKAAEISMRTFPESAAAADREPHITKAARVSKQPKLGKVLKRGGRGRK